MFKKELEFKRQRMDIEERNKKLRLKRDKLFEPYRETCTAALAIQRQLSSQRAVKDKLEKELVDQEELLQRTKNNLEVATQNIANSIELMKESDRKIQEIDSHYIERCEVQPKLDDEQLNSYLDDSIRCGITSSVGNSFKVVLSRYLYKQNDEEIMKMILAKTDYHMISKACDNEYRQSVFVLHTI